MISSLYLKHEYNSAVACDCIVSNAPNYSTFCFSMVFSTTNQYNILSDTFITSPVSSNKLKPVHSSTPTRVQSKEVKGKHQQLRILIVNFQSIKSKQHLLDKTISSSHPDITFSTETWIENSIKDSQIFPKGIPFLEMIGIDFRL